MPLESATVSGQIFQGDALYLRDGSAADFVEIVGRSLDLAKKVKLICLYEMFGLADCAAEMICEFKDEIATVVDTKEALDLLTPPVEGRRVEYDTYVEIFDTERARFLPSRYE